MLVAITMANAAVNAQMQRCNLPDEDISNLVHWDSVIYKLDIGDKDVQSLRIGYGLMAQRQDTSYYTDSIQLSADTGVIQNLYKQDISRKYSSRFKMGIRQLITEHLLPITMLDANIAAEEINCRLAKITHVETLTWLELILRELIDSVRKDPNRSPQLNLYILEDNIETLHAYLLKRMKTDFTFYNFTDISKTKVKYFYIDHINDFLFPIYNDDRDLTGGFRFEVGTDLLKMRVFNYGDKWWNPNSRSWYSYQAVFVGGEGYTPYLRDTMIFNTPTAVDSFDRPYGSFQYLGRVKYRISRHGRMRIKSEIKLGIIGGKFGQAIQSFIHRDVITSSFEPMGWKAQIANGGRLGWSIEHYLEYKLGVKNKYLKRIFIPLETQIGSQLTAISSGICLGNLNFKESGGWNWTFNRNTQHMPIRKLKFSDIVSVYNKTLIRYVIHNTMLEGYGVLKHNQDELKTNNPDMYVIPKKFINRWVFMNEFVFSIKLRYCGIVYKALITSPEYNISYPNKKPNYKPMDYYNDKGVHNSSRWNHTGTIGLIFLIE